MKIYRFRKLTNVDDFCRLCNIIKTGRFWCSKFWELNDPMEGVFSTNNPNTIEKIFSEKEKYKICSFSGEEGFKNPAMWGYYANGFKGVAIEIETDLRDGMCGEQGGVKKIKPDNNLTNDLDIEKILLNKDYNWEHEDEYRFLIKLGDNNYHNHRHKIGKKINAIYFGNPYGNIKNQAQVKEKNKSFEQYDQFKKKIKEIAKDEDIECFDVEVHLGKVKKKDTKKIKSKRIIDGTLDLFESKDDSGRITRYLVVKSYTVKEVCLIVSGAAKLEETNFNNKQKAINFFNNQS